MSVLSGEKVGLIAEGREDVLMFDVWCQVDIHVMKEPPSGEWTFLATELTDKSGRITYKVYREFYNFLPSYKLKLYLSL